MTDLAVANTIRTQLGQRALFMLGAKNLAGDSNSLGFRIGRNAKTVNAIRITLDPCDTYTIRFIRVRGSKITTVAECSDVYADALHATIERQTGLYTSL